MDRRALVAASTVALTLLTTSCGASSGGNGPAPTPIPRDCRSLIFPYPTPDAVLSAADNGKTVHLPLGALLEVDLLGSPSRRWSPIVLTGTAIISLGTQAETPTVGTRLGEYCAVGDGKASLSATDGTLGWTADIVVP
jgi:hypothetical protein